MSVDYDRAAAAIAKKAVRAVGFVPHFGGAWALHRSYRSSSIGGFDQKRLPTGLGGIQIILEAVATGLHQTTQREGEELAPLMRITRVAVRVGDHGMPDVDWNHGGVTGGANSHSTVIKDLEGFNWAIATALICAIDG